MEELKPTLVPVVLRLVGSVDGHAYVIGLFVTELGQLGP